MSSRWLRWSTILLLGLLPLCGAQASGQTPSESQPDAWHRHGGRPLIGTVVSVSDGSVVLTTWSGQSVTAQTTPTTRVLSRQQASLSDLRSGDVVRVVATRAQDGSLSARMVSDIPAALVPSTSRGGLWDARAGAVMISGRLTGLPADGVVTIALPAGPPLSMSVPSTAHLSRLVSMAVSSLAPGAHVLVRGTRNADDSFTATTIFVASGIQR